MLSKSKNHLAHFKLIGLHENSSSIFCDHCLSLDIFCIMMTDHSKCAECTHHEHLCVDIFLKSLNCTHKKLKFKLKIVVKECAEHSVTVVRLNAKLIRLLSQIKHNKLLFILKTHCVAIKLDDDNDETENLSFFLMLQLINSMSSFF